MGVWTASAAASSAVLYLGRTALRTTALACGLRRCSSARSQSASAIARTRPMKAAMATLFGR
jgi:hypothetical protein